MKPPSKLEHYIDVFFRKLHFLGVHDWQTEILDFKDRPNRIEIKGGKIQNPMGKTTCSICGKVKVEANMKGKR